MKILIVANYIKGSGGISIVVSNHFKKLKSVGNFVDIFNTKKNPLARLYLIIPLLVKIKKYDVIHVHGCSSLGFFPIVLGITASKFIYNKKTIVTYHGGGAKQFLIRHHRFVKFFLKKADHITIMSEFLQNVFKEYGIETAVLPNLLDFEQENNFSFNCSIPKLVSIRSLYKNYNIVDILDAFKSIKNKYKDSELKIMSEGPEMDNLMTYCKNEGLTDVKFLGKVPHNEISNELIKSNILVSVPTDDNQPMSILEAFENKILVISSKVGGIPDIIKDNITGLLVDVNRPDQITEKVDWIINNPIEAKAITENAYIELKRFQWGAIGPQLINLYKN